METEKLEFVSLDDFKQDLINQDPTFAEGLTVHKLQQAMVMQLKAIALPKNFLSKILHSGQGLKPQNISRIERGLVIPKADTLIRYAQALGGSFQYIPSNV